MWLCLMNKQTHIYDGEGGRCYGSKKQNNIFQLPFLQALISLCINQTLPCLDRLSLRRAHGANSEQKTLLFQATAVKWHLPNAAINFLIISGQLMVMQTD